MVVHPRVRGVACRGGPGLWGQPVHPRQRGVGCVLLGADRQPTGSSPRAGLSCPLGPGGVSPPVYPRVRGAAVAGRLSGLPCAWVHLPAPGPARVLSAGLRALRGFYPRGREAIGARQSGSGSQRFIPASAGPPLMICNGNTLCPVHSRPGRDGATTCSEAGPSFGSSPRARGRERLVELRVSRVTLPPRACGETLGICVEAALSGGPSPRARGRYVDHLRQSVDPWFIPACAGAILSHCGRLSVWRLTIIGRLARIPGYSFPGGRSARSVSDAREAG